MHKITPKSMEHPQNPKQTQNVFLAMRAINYRYITDRHDANMPTWNPSRLCIPILDPYKVHMGSIQCTWKCRQGRHTHTAYKPRMLKPQIHSNHKVATPFS